MFDKRTQTAKIALVHPPADSEKATEAEIANLQKFAVPAGTIPESTEQQLDARQGMRPLLERVTRDQVVATPVGLSFDRRIVPGLVSPHEIPNRILHSLQERSDAV